MKKLLFILFALPMLWGCKEKDTEEPQPLTEWEQRIVDATEVVNQVIADYGDYKAEEVAELLCGKKTFLDSYLEYDTAWQEIIAVSYLEGRCYCEGYNPSNMLFSLDGTVMRSNYIMNEEGGEEFYQQVGTWRFLAENRTIELEWTRVDESTYIQTYLLQALSDDCFVWDELNGQRNFRYIHDLRLDNQLLAP